MQVRSACEYLTGGESRDGGHWEPYKLICAIKGIAFRGYADITVRGVSKRLRSENADDAIEWAGMMLADRIHAEFGAGAISLVPIPGHEDVSIGAVKAGRLYRLCEAISNAIPGGQARADVRALRHLQAASKSARDGGPRDPEVLSSNLRAPILGLAASAASNRTLVLVDDVSTSGGHLRAAHAVLRARAARNLSDVAYVVGRTVHVKGAPFGDHVEELEPFDFPPPPPPF